MKTDIINITVFIALYSGVQKFPVRSSLQFFFEKFLKKVFVKVM